MLTPKELILRTFDLRKVPRIPVAFLFHFIMDAETENIVINNALLDESLKAHKSFIRTFRPDMMKIMPDGFFFYPIEGPLDDVDDLNNIQPVDFFHPWIDFQMELATEVRKTDETIPYFFTIFSPLSYLKFLVGLRKLVLWLEYETEKVAAALDRMAESLSELAKELIEARGLDGIYLSVQNPDIESFSSDFYQERVSPSELRILDAAREAGGRNILHICGDLGVKNRLTDYASYPASAVCWARSLEKASFPQARSIFGNKALIAGFPNGYGSVLHNGSKEEVEAYALELLKEIGDMPGAIIGADCSAPADIEWERFSWVREIVGANHSLSKGAIS
jgi:uroporphyrinogen decarboxylase